MFTKKILKTPYTKVKVKDLILPSGTPEIVEYLLGYKTLVEKTYFDYEDFTKLLRDKSLELGLSVYLDNGNFGVGGATQTITISDIDLSWIPIGTKINYILRASSTNEGYYFRFINEDGTQAANLGVFFSNAIGSFTTNKVLSHIEIRRYSISYNTKFYIYPSSLITLSNMISLKFDTPINISEPIDTTKIIDDKTSFIPIALRDLTIGTLKDYFTNEEIVTLFNYFVDYNYNLSTSYLTTEGIDDFYRRFRRLNTKALFRLATRINKIVELLNTDKMQDRKDIISRIKIDMLDKDDVISNTSNIKQADNPSSITGELVDTFTTSQQKAISNGTNAINEERNVTDNESVSSEGPTINKINDYYNSINFDIIDEYVNSFNSLIIVDDEDDLQFEDF